MSIIIFRNIIRATQYKAVVVGVRPSSFLRRFASASNFNDPDASKPTLSIDPFKKSERLKRPTAPHLTIYQPQLTWLLSGFHRITGCAVGGLFYLGAIAFATLPIDSTALVSLVHSYPGGILFLAKAIIAFPLFFHSFNGVRHLIWDTASGLTLKGVYNTGYTVLGLSAFATLVFAIFF